MAKNNGKAPNKKPPKSKKDPLQAKKDKIDLAIVGIGIVLGIFIGMVVFTSMNPGNEEDPVSVQYDIQGGGIAETMNVGLRCEDLYTGIKETQGFGFDVDDRLVTVNKHKAAELGGTHWKVEVDGNDVTDSLSDVEIKEGMVVFFRLVIE